MIYLDDILVICNSQKELRKNILLIKDTPLGIDHQQEEIAAGTLTGASVLGVSTVDSYHDDIPPS